MDTKPVKPAHNKLNQDYVTCFTLQIPLSLSLPPHPSTSDLLFHPFTLLHLLLRISPSHWVIFPSSPVFCRNHVWNLILSVRLHHAPCHQGAPTLLPFRSPTLHISCQTLTSPTWGSSPPSFLCLPTLASLFFALLYSLCLSPPFTSGFLFLVSWTCLVPSVHRWLNAIRQAYSSPSSCVPPSSLSRYNYSWHYFFLFLILLMVCHMQVDGPVSWTPTWRKKRGLEVNQVFERARGRTSSVVSMEMGDITY